MGVVHYIVFREVNLIADRVVSQVRKPSLALDEVSTGFILALVVENVAAVSGDQTREHSLEDDLLAFDGAGLAHDGVTDQISLAMGQL